MGKSPIYMNESYRRNLFEYTRIICANGQSVMLDRLLFQLTGIMAYLRDNSVETNKIRVMVCHNGSKGLHERVVIMGAR